MFIRLFVVATWGKLLGIARLGFWLLIMTNETTPSDADLEVARKRALDFERQRRRDKLIERSVFFGTLTFVAVLAALVYNTDNQVSRFTASVIRSVGGSGGNAMLARNPVIACRDPKNAKTPWCQEYKGKQDSTWRAIERQSDGANAFTLHGNGGN